MLSADSDYKKIMKKNPEKDIENYDDLRAFENRCLMEDMRKKLRTEDIEKIARFLKRKAKDVKEVFRKGISECHIENISEIENKVIFSLKWDLGQPDKRILEFAVLIMSEWFNLT
jgi:hypothetical protein